MKRYKRHSEPVLRTARWKSLRFEILERDGFACVACGARGRLEVDHVLPVVARPDLAFAASNLQSLCPRCHGTKARTELGFPEISPERRKWRDLLRDMQRNPIEQKGKSDA